MTFERIRSASDSAPELTEPYKDALSSHAPHTATAEMARLFRTIVENSHSGILIADSNFKIIYGNNELTALFGGRQEDYLYQDFRKFIATEDQSLVVDRYIRRQSGQSHLPTRYEFKIIRKNGELRDVEISTSVVNTADGQPLTVAQILDITDRKRAQEILSNREKKYRDVFENVRDFIFIHDLEGNIIESNYQRINQGGFSQSDIRNTNIRLLMPEHLRPEFDDYLERIQENGTDQGVMRIIAKNGHELIIAYNTSLIKGPDGPETIHGIARDITEEYEAKKALKCSAEALRKAHAELEARVAERTIALQKANEELEAKTGKLEEVNTALRILLKRRAEDKSELETQMLFNLKELVLPYLDKLYTGELSEKQKAYLDIVRSNLNDIASPFVHGLASKYLSMTPTEIQVANFIKHGKTSKEIAQLLNLSSKTIESHRKNIRRKIGIKNTKANLRTHLLSLQ